MNPPLLKEKMRKKMVVCCPLLLEKCRSVSRDGPVSDRAEEERRGETEGRDCARDR